MADIIQLHTETVLDIPVERVLQAAVDAGLRQVVVLGYTPEGDEYFASSTPDAATMLWLVERFKKRLLSTGE